MSLLVVSQLLGVLQWDEPAPSSLAASQSRCWEGLAGAGPLLGAAASLP